MGIVVSLDYSVNPEYIEYWANLVASHDPDLAPPALTARLVAPLKPLPRDWLAGYGYGKARARLCLAPEPTYVHDEE